jgi:predicted AAA+ superfamily ATPase
LDEKRLREGPTIKGPLVENFVFMELRKQIGWSEVLPQMYHFRTGEGQEIDIVLEDASGRLVGIEIKTSATIGPDAFKGLNTLAEKTGKKFLRGIVLYGGAKAVSFDKNMYALPLNALWQM